LFLKLAVKFCILFLIDKTSASPESVLHEYLLLETKIFESAGAIFNYLQKRGIWVPKIKVILMQK
jgi:hypothetical protein